MSEKFVNEKKLYNLFVRNSKIVQYIMGIHQKAFNDYISPAVSNCGMIMKMEPSVLYPMSQVSSQKSHSMKKKRKFLILLSCSPGRYESKNLRR